MGFAKFGKAGKVADDINRRFSTVFACGSENIVNVGFEPGYTEPDDIIGASACIMHHYGYGDLLNATWQNAVGFAMEEQGRLIDIADGISVLCVETNPETKEAQLTFTIKKEVTI